MRPESQAFAKAREKLAMRLRELRQERGLSQEELADLAGCHRTYIGMLERKLGNPSLSIIGAIAYALDVDVAQLISGDE